MKALRLLAIGLLATVAVAGQAVKLTSSNGSSVTIKGTSTMHDWTVSGNAINGSLVVADSILAAASNDALSAVPPQATIDIPVASIKAEHDRMNKLMAEALKGEKNPVIRYQLTGASLAKGGLPFIVNTNGKLTIAGSTQNVTMQVTGAKQGDKLVLTGETPIKMTSFGVKPPTAMMGTIKTGDDVKVSFRWVVEAAR